MGVHSFSSVALPHEPNQDPERPEICTGTDASLAPFQDDEKALEIPGAHDFTEVALNRPLSDSIVPAKHWNRTPKVRSAMIGVRRDFYMDEANGDQRSDFDAVAALVSRLVEGLHETWATNSI